MEEMRLSLRDIIDLFLFNIKMIVTITLIFAIATLIYSATMIVPKYQTDVTLYVNNTKVTITDRTTSSDLSTSQMLVPTCINLINTDIMSSEVAKADGLGYSAAQIKSMTTASQVGGTEILKITIRGTEPNDVARIADTYADVVPEVIGGNGGIVEACSIRLIDKAKVPQAPYSPNVTRNTIIGFIVGLIISCSFILIREILDSRIKNESDLEELFQAPILGTIPQIGTGNKGHYGYYNNAKSGAYRKTGYGLENLKATAPKKDAAPGVKAETEEKAVPDTKTEIAAEIVPEQVPVNEVKPEMVVEETPVAETVVEAPVVEVVKAEPKVEATAESVFEALEESPADVLDEIAKIETPLTDAIEAEMKEGK